jgi:hypothetical protein
MDLHHVSGRANDSLTIPVPVNDHRAELTTAMMDWPKETRDNLEGAPLLAVAARIRGSCDMNAYQMESLLLPGAEFLEHLHALFTEKFGEKYWTMPSSPRNTPRN